MARPRPAPPQRRPPPAPTAASCGGYDDEKTPTHLLAAGTPGGVVRLPDEGPARSCTESGRYFGESSGPALAGRSDRRSVVTKGCYGSRLRPRFPPGGWRGIPHAGSADLGHDLGRDQLQMIQVVQV